MSSNEVSALKIELSKIKKFKFDYRYIPIKDDNVDKHLLLIWEAITLFEYSLPDLFVNKEQFLYRRFEGISAEISYDLKKILITKYAGYLSDVVDYDVTVEIDNFNKVFNKILEIKKQKIHSFQLLKNNNEIEVEILDSTIVNFEIEPLQIELIEQKFKNLGPAKRHYVAINDGNMDEYLFLVWSVIKSFSGDLQHFLKRHKVDQSKYDDDLKIEVVDHKTLRLGEFGPSYEEEDYNILLDVEYENFVDVFDKYKQFMSFNVHSFQLTRDDNKISIELLKEEGKLEESRNKPILLNKKFIRILQGAYEICTKTFKNKMV